MKLPQNLSAKKITVVGYGKEGQSSVDFLIKKGALPGNITIADQVKQEVSDNRVNMIFGKDYLNATVNADIIIRSPGVPFSLISKKKDQLLTSQTDIFLSKHGSSTIGITGTKGKSTTAKMIYEIISKEGFRAFLVGNIGNPALDYFDEDHENTFFVYELSSFQLQGVSSSPHIAVFLNLFPDHLDKHQNMQEYIVAKENITRFQSEKDVFIFNNEDKVVKEVARRTKARKMPFNGSSEKLTVTPTAPARMIADIIGIEKDSVEKSIADFAPLPHRHEYIGRYKMIDFYNDSAATVPEATIAAINSTKNIKTIILGGSEKGSSTVALVEKIKSSTIENVVILEGTTESLIKDIFATNKKTFIASSMEEAVDMCYKETPPGGACVLSPGFASFNMFKNQRERGDSFRRAVTVKSNEK